MLMRSILAALTGLTVILGFITIYYFLITIIDVTTERYNPKRNDEHMNEHFVKTELYNLFLKVGIKLPPTTWRLFIVLGWIFYCALAFMLCLFIGCMTWVSRDIFFN